MMRLHLAILSLAVIFCACVFATTAEAQDSPKPLSSWVLDGELLDDENTVRSFLRPLIQKSGNWSQEDQKQVIEFLLDFGYHTEISNAPLDDGSVQATIRVQPATLVRYIEVLVTIGYYERFRQPIFADELARKMTLRPGSPLAKSESERQTQLDAEGERIRQFLVDDGFFEAKVSVRVEKKSAFEAKVVVSVTPGPAYFIGEITITGNSAIRSEDIVKGFKHPRVCVILELCFGEQRFSRKQLRKDIRGLIRRYQKEEGFPGVRIHANYDPRHSFDRETRKANLEIEVSERRRIDVDIDGNTSYSDVDLSKQLTIFEQASYDDVEVQNSANSLRNFYQSKGFFEAQVNWKRERFVDLNFERILLFVDEGPRLRVRSVQFHGNKSIPSRILAAPLGTQIHRRRIIGGASGHTTTGLLEQDKQRILSKYRSAGYLETKVKMRVGRSDTLSGLGPSLAASIAGQQKSSGLYVHFDIDEGKPSRIGKISLDFEGDHTIDEPQLRKLVAIQTGQSFLQESVKSSRERLQRYYFSQGYPRAAITTRIEQKGLQYHVHFSISENSPAKIGEIAIRGNFKTRDWVIRQESGLHQGALVTTSLINRAQATLRQSGLFSAASISVIGQNTIDQEVVNLIVRVQENRDYKYSYKAGAGYATDSEEFIELGGGVPNIGGIGANVDLDIILGQQQRSGVAKLQIPRWVMKRYLGAGLTTDLSLNGLEDETERFGELTTVGGSLAFSRQGRSGIFKGVSLSMRYDYRRRQRDIDLVRPAGNNGDIDQAKTTTIGSSLGPTLVIDKRRDQSGTLNPLNPRSGFRFELGAKFAEDYFVGSNRFVKFGVSGQHYWPLHKRVMLSSSLSYDQGVPLGGDALLPDVERYFAGGDTTVRGYEEDRLAIELIDNPLAGAGSITQFRVVPAGGNIRIIQNIDLQLEVWDLFGFPIASAFFADTGIITNSLVGVEVGDLGVGVGVALARWISPFGTLSFEYAVPLTLKISDNPRGRWHVNFGVLYN